MVAKRTEHGEVCALMLALTAFGNVASDSLPDGIFDMRSSLIAFCALARGESTPRELAERTRLTTSGVTRLLDRMEDQGWIRRQYGADVDDRRSAHIRLTPKGRRQTVKLMAGIAASLNANQPVVVGLRDALEPFIIQR